MKSFNKTQSLVYVPNSYCNFACSYCYLGLSTNNKNENLQAITINLKKILDSMLDEGVLANEIILHGAEVTTIPRKHLEELFGFIQDYFNQYSLEIKTLGYKTPKIHIKTNLYNFDKLYDLFESYNVSISASIDMPLHLHSKYRKLKNGKDTLDVTLKNLELLKNYNGSKGISCVVTQETLKYKNDFINDIKYLHEVIGFNMIENFYIMFAYDSKASDIKFAQDKEEGAVQLTQTQMSDFYEFVKASFKDTPYYKAIQYNWFKEFLTGYCTACKNCGEDFLLVQANGDAYPCHRTQLDKEFKFGNIFEDGYAKVKENAPLVIQKEEAKTDIDKECLSCEYFNYCYLSCVLIRKETMEKKSYTCKLQKSIYKDNPLRFPPQSTESKKQMDTFIKENNPITYDEFKKDIPRIMGFNPEFMENKNSLSHLALNDKKLKPIYTPGIFKISINEEVFDLHSPLVRPYQEVYTLDETMQIKLYIQKDYFNVNCKQTDLVNNYLDMSLLRDTAVVYGDEQRTKQEHIYNKNIYFNTLEKSVVVDNEYFVLDMKEILEAFKESFLEGVVNNLFFSTKESKKYHYEKQKENAFYHIQAINLPFHNFQFYWEK